MLTIQQVQTMLSALETNITLQLQAFKEQTGLTIHSVPVVDNGASVGATVKIIIPPAVVQVGQHK